MSGYFFLAQYIIMSLFTGESPPLLKKSSLLLSHFPGLCNASSYSPHQIYTIQLASFIEDVIAERVDRSSTESRGRLTKSINIPGNVPNTEMGSGHLNRKKMNINFKSPILRL